MEKHILKDVDNEAFAQHCKAIADKMGVDPIVVRELLLDYSFGVLDLLQSAILKNRFIKVNIFGFFSFVTKKNDYKKIKKP